MDFSFRPNRQRRSAEPEILRNPERGVVEIKPAEYDLDSLTDDAQIVRYLGQYGLILITNLREFRLLQLNSSGTVQTLECCDKSLKISSWLFKGLDRLNLLTVPVKFFVCC